MFERPTNHQLLEYILNDYAQMASSNPNNLRELIPAQEVWRFFIEAEIQQKGRRLSNTSIFKNSASYQTMLTADPADLTVKDFMTSIENVNFRDKSDWGKSLLWKTLKAKHWQLSEAQCEKWTLKDLLALDKAWMPFEMNEPNYFNGMYQGLNEIFDASNVLSTDFIKKLNRCAVSNVRGTNYDDDQQGIGQFRSWDETGFLLTPSCASQRGLHEFFSSNDTELGVFLRFFIDGDLIGMLKLNTKSIELIRQYSRQQYHFASRGDGCKASDFAPFCIAGNVKVFFDQIKMDSVSSSLVEKIGHSGADEEVSKIVYDLLRHRKSSQQCDVYYVSNQSTAATNDFANELRQCIDTYISAYQAAIAIASSPMQKLEAIIDFIQQCELLHPFHDANGRTFCMLLLNYLLITQGFPLALLDDSNKFNLYSKQEMLDSLIDSMGNTIVLINNKKLFGIDTADILRMFESNPAFSELKKYFDRLIELENANRVAVNSPLKSSPFSYK